MQAVVDRPPPPNRHEPRSRSAEGRHDHSLARRRGRRPPAGRRRGRLTAVTRPAPSVSVVLPTANRRERLGAALASALAQTHGHLEVIIVDDASTTAVDDIVEAAADRARPADPPAGQRRGRRRPQHGPAGGAGDLIAFIDDDDRWDRVKVARQVAFLDAHPEVGLVTSDHHIEREDGRNPSLVYRGPRAGRRRSDALGELRGELLLRHGPPAPGRTRRWPSTRPSPRAEDWDLWLRCSRLGPIGRVHEPLVAYVSHDGPRLSRTDLKRRGLKLFELKRGASMSSPCRAFNRAHQQMDTGAGVAKRAHVLRALATPSLHTWPCWSSSRVLANTVD